MSTASSFKLNYIKPDDVAYLIRNGDTSSFLVIGAPPLPRSEPRRLDRPRRQGLHSDAQGCNADTAYLADVRSSDFPGGNLPGALNLHTGHFRSDQDVCVHLPPCSSSRVDADEHLSLFCPLLSPSTFLLLALLALLAEPFSPASSFAFPRSERVIKQHISPRLPALRTVILHCMRSQTRGPYAASLLQRSPALPPNLDVVVLEGGFQGWLRRYRGEKALFENFEGQGSGEWEDVVNAPEGSRLEADDSRRLREGMKP